MKNQSVRQNHGKERKGEDGKEGEGGREGEGGGRGGRGRDGPIDGTGIPPKSSGNTSHHLTGSLKESDKARSTHLDGIFAYLHICPLPNQAGARGNPGRASLVILQEEANVFNRFTSLNFISN